MQFELALHLDPLFPGVILGMSVPVPVPLTSPILRSGTLARAPDHGAFGCVGSNEEPAAKMTVTTKHQWTRDGNGETQSEAGCHAATRTRHDFKHVDRRFRQSATPTLGRCVLYQRVLRGSVATRVPGRAITGPAFPDACWCAKQRRRIAPG
jgi:hypothetical protein